MKGGQTCEYYLKGFDNTVRRGTTVLQIAEEISKGLGEMLSLLSSTIKLLN